MQTPGKAIGRTPRKQFHLM